jgi:23S rRNA (guanosine2251-2'-O)-methyltransferase
VSATGEVVFGYHAIEELLRRGSVRGTLMLSRQSSRITALRELAERAGVEVSEVAEAELTRLCGTPDHKGAVLSVASGAAVQRGGLRVELQRLGDRATVLALVLDGLTDPQNLGAVLRSADLFGVEAVVIPSRRSAQETATVARVSAGASAYVPLVVVPNLPSALELLKEHGFWIYGAEMGGPAAHRTDLRGRICLVLGSEGEGMHRLVRERCDATVGIPAAGHVDSFNVSVAAGILMYEVRRQQGFFDAGSATGAPRGSARPAGPR